MPICYYNTILGQVTVQITEGQCYFSIPDISSFGAGCESGHISVSPILAGGGIIGYDEFGYTSDYDSAFLQENTCASATHNITAGNGQEGGFWSSWHFRYFRVTDPNGVVYGKSTWQYGFNNINNGLTASAAVPIQSLINGATAYGSGTTLNFSVPQANTGTYTFELMQVPLPKIGATYTNSVGVNGPDMVAILVPTEDDDGSVQLIVATPKFFTPLQHMASLTCEQFPHYGINSATYWQELFPSGSSTSAASLGTAGVGNGYAGTDDWFDGIKSFRNGTYYDITTGRCGAPPPRVWYDCNPHSLTAPHCHAVTYATAYATAAACDAFYSNGCASPSTYYDCVGGICQVVTGPTSYTSLSACQLAYPNGCIPVPTDYFDCHVDSGCIQVTGPTAYTSLVDCQTAFPDGCDPRPPVNPPEIPCIEEYAYKSFCAIKEYECNNRLLCKDDDFIKFLKLLSLRSAGNAAADTGEDDVIDNIVSLINLICECDNTVGRT